MKKSKKRIILQALVLATHHFIFLFLNYRTIATNQMFIANGLYSHWSSEFTGESLDEIINLQQSHRVFIEHTLNGNIRTFNGTGDWEPPLLEGSFFSYESQEPLAVVGSRMLPEEGNTFVFEGQTFQITGILGATFPSILDYIVLLNDIGYTFPVERTIIDTDSRGDIEGIFDSGYFRPAFSQSELTQFETQFSFGRDIFEEMMVINTVLIASLFLIITSHAYLIMTKDNNDILHLQGFTGWEIIAKNHQTLSVTFLLAFLTTILVDVILGNQILMQHIEIYLGLFMIQHLIYFLMVGYDKLKKGASYIV